MGWGGGRVRGGEGRQDFEKGHGEQDRLCTRQIMPTNTVEGVHHLCEATRVYDHALEGPGMHAHMAAR